MRAGLANPLATGILAVGFAFVAKDLTIPLLGLAFFGMIDRVIRPDRA